MRAAIRNLALAQALAVAFTFTVGSTISFAENAKDEPTVEDLKNSKERNVILLPRSSQSIYSKTETKPSHVTGRSIKNTQPARTVKKRPPVQAKTPAQTVNPPAKAAVQTAMTASSVPSSGDSIINVWLDKKGATPQYKNGDKMKINVSASQDCNVMIFDFDGRGKLTQLYPNEYQQKTLLRAGDTITFGGADSPFDYQVSLPKGSTHAQERIFVYAYPLTEKPLSIALGTEDGTPFRSGEMTLAQYKKMVAESKVFFNNSNKNPQTSNDRDVKIVPKTPTGAPALKLVVADDEKSGQPNKKELSFTIHAN
ncbi:MAG TPA: DUF4384 domain-containing protein [Candidatus Melainabacteria bacterium]|nr:DUF4384 domain-containing protein [Candidatus Melainabacteria bacterium]HIN66717.1 DUF4384 domain-containing protein [Candidatus Obscuribacterales bacterium]